jgi:hypothetical protein
MFNLCFELRALSFELSQELPMYEFVTGPLAWLSFAIFFVGNIVRLVLYVRGLDWKLDRVTYSVNTNYGVRGAVRSIVYWLIPLAPQLAEQPGVLVF